MKYEAQNLARKKFQKLTPKFGLLKKGCCMDNSDNDARIWLKFSFVLLPCWRHGRQCTSIGDLA